MTPALERTAALLEDRAVMERLLHDAANYAWEHHGPASSRAFFDRVKVALANYDALLAEAARLRALPEPEIGIWALSGPSGVIVSEGSLESAAIAQERCDFWNDNMHGGPYRVVALAVVEDPTPTGERG